MAKTNDNDKVTLSDLTPEKLLSKPEQVKERRKERERGGYDRPQALKRGIGDIVKGMFGGYGGPKTVAVKSIDQPARVRVPGAKPEEDPSPEYKAELNIETSPSGTVISEQQPRKTFLPDAPIADVSPESMATSALVEESTTPSLQHGYFADPTKQVPPKSGQVWVEATVKDAGGKRWVQVPQDMADQVSGGNISYSDVAQYQ